jgi:hypothetical protein
MKPTIIHSALFGVAIGDALGVPVEMNSRATLDAQPVQDLDQLSLLLHNDISAQPQGSHLLPAPCRRNHQGRHVLLYEWQRL